MAVLFNDKNMLRFLLIISGFWFMFMQLWDLLPNFIDEWVDTRDVGAFLTSILGTSAQSFLTADGAAKPEILINIDSFTIIILVLPLSWFFGKFRMIVALLTGMAIGLVGFMGAGMTAAGTVCAFMIFVFAIGEIICSPKFSEYIGMTAPLDKKALYMGYSNIPFAIGWAAGNGVSGPLYDTFASRTVFARQYLVDTFGLSQDLVDKIEPAKLLTTIAEKMGNGATIYDVKMLLWQTYNPWMVWVILGVVGLASLLGMVYFYARAEKKN